MPHSSKKYRKQAAAAAAKSGRSNMTTYAIVAIIAVVIAAAAGWYVYSTYLGTSATTTTTTTNSLIYAKIYTSMGVMEIELFSSQTPQTVSNFVNLSKSGFYDNLVWHRIVKGFVIQTGDPLTRNGGGNRTLWGSGGSGHTVPLEAVASLHNDYSYIGMARGASVNSGSSQFYINVANNTSLDGRYTVFGKVINGMDVALAIASVQVNSQDQPITPVYMTNITILSSGP